MPDDDPRWMGGIGMIGTKAVYNAVMHCDLLLMVGTDYPYSNSCRGKARASGSTNGPWRSGGAHRPRLVPPARRDRP